MKEHEKPEWYYETTFSRWRRSDGSYIYVENMAKFHLIAAAKKLVRINMQHLPVYEGICDRLRNMRKPDEVYDFELGGAL